MSNIKSKRLDAKAQVVTGKIIKISAVLDLSAVAAEVSHLLHALRNYVVKAISYVYQEGSTADSGVKVIVGKESDDNYYADETSEISKAQWYTKSVTPLNTDLNKGDTLYVSNAGAKVGAGAIIVIVELLPKLDNYD